MTDLPVNEGRNQRRHDLWQTAGWLIVLLCTLPLIGGPIIGLSRVPDVIAILLLLFVVAGLFWLWLLYRGGRLRLATPLDLSLLAIMLALLLSTALSIDPSRSWRVTAHWAAFIVAFYMATVAFRSRWRPANFIRAYLIILAIYILAGYGQLIAGLAVGDQTSRLTLRVSGLANNPNPFAILLTVGLVLALGAYLDRPSGSRSRSPLIWLIAAGPMVVFHGSRNGWLATVAGLAGLLLFRQLRKFSPQRPPLRAWLTLGAFVIIALSASLALVLLLRPNTLNPATASDFANRTIFWQIAVESWREQPLFGQGPGTFATAFLMAINVPGRPLFVAAHSLVFNTLSEMGLVGLAAFAYFSGQFGRLALRSLRDGRWTPETPGLLAALLAIGAFCLFDTPWVHLIFLTSLILAAFTAQVEPAQTALENISAWRARLSLIWLPAWALLIVAGLLGWQAATAYGRGLEAGRRANWSAAASHFAAAQQQMPYRDASFSLAQGYAAGVLATADDSYLAAAIDHHEDLVAREPGWSLNWANLAALRWQAGDAGPAISAMERAITRAPAVPLYHLNLALWLEALGQTEAAANAYERLLTLAPAVEEVAFWSATEARRAAFAERPSPGLSKPERVEPPLDSLSQSQARDLAGRLLSNSLYGFGLERRSTYMRDVFVRLDTPAELLPQLRCPAPDAQGRQRLADLRALAERQGWAAIAAAIDDAPAIGPDGLVPCAPADMAAASGD